MLSGLCQFPVAPVTNRHKLGLKRHKFVLLQFGVLQVRNQLHGAEVKVLAGMVPSGGCEGKPIPLTFFVSCYLVAPSSILRVYHSDLCLPHYIINSSDSF